MLKIVLATHNPHKVSEIRGILHDMTVEMLSLDNFPEVGEIEEDGLTLEENARKKAQEVYKLTGITAMADDTGLEVDYLNGAPGVFSARYAGGVGMTKTNIGTTEEENNSRLTLIQPDYEANNSKLLSQLDGVAWEQRGATFRCIISIVGPQIDKLVEGKVRGKITFKPRGWNGFGYDPIFLPDGFDLTYAEMSPDQKNVMSHRAIALQKVRAIISELVLQSSSRE
ncbi:MAG: RdgB/HAM1 family non-canonical purine NTP pyrophosphatase [Candidatus Kryptoniota bacterium]